MSAGTRPLGLEVIFSQQTRERSPFKKFVVLKVLEGDQQHDGDDGGPVQLYWGAHANLPPGQDG